MAVAAEENVVDMPDWVLRGDSIIVSDPVTPRRCVDNPGEYPLAAHVTNARPGLWKAEARMAGGVASGRVSSLLTWCPDPEEDTRKASAGKILVHDIVRVDTAKVGIFDYAEYPTGDSTGERGVMTSLYGNACVCTEGGNVGGSVTHNDVTFGVVAQSGWGDGEFAVITARDKDTKEAVALCVIFFTNEDEDVLETCLRIGTEDGTSISAAADEGEGGVPMVSRDVSYAMIRGTTLHTQAQAARRTKAAA